MRQEATYICAHLLVCGPGGQCHCVYFVYASSGNASRLMYVVD